MTIPVCTTTDGVAATRAFGAALAAVLREGDVVLLSGDLGAGKTVLVQGIAEGLGVDEPVTSPTFALVDEHGAESGVRLLHVDVYRLDSPAEISDLGLADEVEDGRTIAVIEWGERAATVLPGDRLEVGISEGESPDDRVFEMNLIGPSWEARRGQLIMAVRRSAADDDWIEGT